MARLGDLVTVLSGFAFDSASFTGEGAIPIARIRDVVRGYSSTFYKGEFDPAFAIENGDLLIGMDGNFHRGTWTGGRALLNQRVCRLRSIPETLDERYLYHFLPRALKLIEDQTPYATVKHLSVRTIREIDIPLPPLPEQRRIAAILDAADQLRHLRIRNLSATRMRLEDETENFFRTTGASEVRLGSMIVNSQNGVYAPASSYGSGTPILRIADFSAGDRLNHPTLQRVAVDSAVVSKFALSSGDLIVNRVNSMSHLGKAALVSDLNESTIFESNMMRIAVDRDQLHPDYLLAWLSTASAKAQIRGAAKQAINQASINQTDVAGFALPLVSLEQQRNLLGVLDEGREVSLVQRQHLCKLDELFASLQHRAFRGEL